jgi:hypothetical protein
MSAHGFSHCPNGPNRAESRQSLLLHDFIKYGIDHVDLIKEGHFIEGIYCVLSEAAEENDSPFKLLQ